MPTGPVEETVIVPFKPRVAVDNDKPEPPKKKGEQKLVDKEGTWGSAVAMLQSLIDDIEAGRRKPEDMFIGIYTENKADDTYVCSMLRYNLSPLELLGRLAHFQRDLGF